MNRDLEVPTPAPWPGCLVDHKLRGEHCHYRYLRWWGSAPVQGVPKSSYRAHMRDAFSCDPLSSQDRTGRALLQLNSCSLGSPRLSAGKETEHLSQAFLGLWCSPKRDYVLPRGGQAGAERRKMTPSRSPVAQGAGLGRERHYHSPAPASNSCQLMFK